VFTSFFFNKFQIFDLNFTTDKKKPAAKRSSTGGNLAEKAKKTNGFLKNTKKPKLNLDSSICEMEKSSIEEGKETFAWIIHPVPIDDFIKYIKIKL